MCRLYILVSVQVLSSEYMYMHVYVKAYLLGER